MRGCAVEKRFAVFTITVADRTGAGLQISTKRLPEQIVGDEKVLSCGFHLEPCCTGQFIGRKTARWFGHEMVVFTEAKRMYENF